jgi:hypothetical protein
MPLLSNLRTLNIPGNEVQRILPYLTGVEVFESNTHLYSDRLSVPHNRPLLPSLRRIIVTQYKGTGKDILGLAEARQIHLGGQNINIATTGPEEDAYLDNSSNATTFLEYCVEHLDRNEIHSALDAASRPPSVIAFGSGSQVERMPLGITLSIYGKRASGYCGRSVESAMRSSCLDTAKRLKELYPAGWKEFWEKKGREKKIIFKVDLRDHSGLDPVILEKLKAYF